MLQMYFDLHTQYGQNFQEELATLKNEKAIKLYYREAGGQDYVQSCISLNQLLNQLCEEVKQKLFNLPLRVVKENLVLTVSKFSVETVNQWCDDLLAYSQHQFEEKGRKILTPNIVKKIASTFLPASGPSKSSLKLHEPVFDEDFQVLLKIKKYGLTPETLSEFIAEVRESVKEQPIVTENLFPFLKKRNLDPLLILSPRDRLRWEFEQKLKEKDKEVEEVRSQVNKLNQQLQQRDEQLEQQQQQINQLVQDKQELKQQNEAQQSEINQLKEQMQEFMKFMQESKSKDLAPVK